MLILFLICFNETDDKYIFTKYVLVSLKNENPWRPFVYPPVVVIVVAVVALKRLEVLTTRAMTGIKRKKERKKEIVYPNYSGKSYLKFGTNVFE